MTPAGSLIHIVADFGTGDDTCAQALALYRLLATHGEIHCWSTGGVPAGGGTPAVRRIHAFGGDFPLGGTLLIIGARQALSPWVERCRARRIVIYSDTRDAEAFFRLSAYLRSIALPEPELAFSTARLMHYHALPGKIIPPVLAVEDFKRCAPDNPPVLAVPLQSRSDVAATLSLCKSCAFAGIDVELLVSAALPLTGLPQGISIGKFSAAIPGQRLSGQNLFYLRTDPTDKWPSPRWLLEAMASGCAVVAAGTDLAEWIVHGENGYLIESTDQAWERIVEIASDAGLRRRLGAAAIPQAERLSGPEARSEIARWLLS